VWIGNDDNTPLRGVHGGGLPARIWHDFTTRALGLSAPKPVPTMEDIVPGLDELPPLTANFTIGNAQLGVDLNQKGLTITAQPRPDEAPPADQGRPGDQPGLRENEPSGQPPAGE